MTSLVRCVEEREGVLGILSDLNLLEGPLRNDTGDTHGFRVLSNDSTRVSL